MNKNIRRLCILILLGIFFPSSPALSKGKTSPPLNILIITVDTLRADHVGCYGYHPIKTPQMDALAGEGVLFEKAFTPVPTTLPAHTSLFTGTYPITHGIKNNGTFALTESAVTLAEQLQAAGYNTAAFISSFVLDSRFGLDQGFNVYDDDLITGVQTPALLQKERRAETVTKAVIQWLNTIKKDKPFFLWVHYYDPHDKYDPPSPFADAYAHCPYDGEIAYVDSWMGVLINKLKEMDIYENTLTVLVSDHGEGLGDHQEETHGIFLYDYAIHVPLIFRYPRQLPKNRRQGSLVRLIDIAPTILAIIGQKIPDHIQGVNLLPLMEGKEKNLQLTLYCETEYPRFTYGWSPLEGIRTDKWKYIKAPKNELYDLTKDPGEEKNVIKKEKRQSERCQKELAKLQQQFISSPGLSPSKSVSLDPSAREKLKSLGYIFSTDSEKKKSYPDPKAMIGLLAYFTKGAEYLGEGKHEKAVAEFKKVLKKDPQNIDVYTCLGAVYQAMGQNDLAIEAYQHALSLGPDHLNNLLQLGNLYIKTKQEEKGKAVFEKILQVNEKCKEAYINLGVYYIGQENWAEARPLLEKALLLEPKDVLAKNHLVSVYHKQGETEEAIALCREILAANPKEPSALNNLGCILMDQKKYPEALESFEILAEMRPDYPQAQQYMGMIHFYQRSFDKAMDAFQKAAAIDPKWVDPHLNLGILYAQYKGDFQKALQEFEKVLEIEPQHTLGQQFFEQTKRSIERFRPQSGK